MICTPDRLRHLSLQCDDHLLLVRAMLRRFPHCSHEQEELYQQGCIGLMKAIARFDPACGTAFSSYTAAMILREMHRLCRLDTPYRLYQNEQRRSSNIRNAEALLNLHLHRSPTIAELSQALRMDPTELLLDLESVHPFSTAAPHRTVENINLQSHRQHFIGSDCLNNSDRRLLLLRLRFGCTQAETARCLGVSPAQISRREMALKRSLSPATAQQA